MLAGAAVINPALENYREAASILAGMKDQSITLFDATVAVPATRLAIEVWTYDRHFDVMKTSVWRFRARRSEQDNRADFPCLLSYIPQSCPSKR